MQIGKPLADELFKYLKGGKDVCLRHYSKP